MKVWVVPGERTLGMLVGHAREGEEEDDSRFLLGRRHRCDAKSLAKGLDERQENVAS